MATTQTAKLLFSCSATKIKFLYLALRDSICLWNLFFVKLKFRNIYHITPNPIKKILCVSGIVNNAENGPIFFIEYLYFTFEISFGELVPQKRDSVPHSESPYKFAH